MKKLSKIQICYEFHFCHGKPGLLRRQRKVLTIRLSTPMVRKDWAPIVYNFALIHKLARLLKTIHIIKDFLLHILTGPFSSVRRAADFLYHGRKFRRYISHVSF